MKIKNIVFDLGNVLIDFDPAGYLRSLGCEDETIQTLLETVFKEDWPRYDRGDYDSVLDLQRELVQKYPAFAPVLRRALQPDWVKIHTLKADTAAYLHELKARGYRIYLLSNLSRESYEFVSSYPFFEDLDGFVFSYRERVCKPDARIYRVLLERYDLIPAQTLFLDDMPRNTEAAKQLGLHAITFFDLPSAKAQAERLLEQYE